MLSWLVSIKGGEWRRWWWWIWGLRHFCCWCSLVFSPSFARVLLLNAVSVTQWGFWCQLKKTCVTTLLQMQNSETHKDNLRWKSCAVSPYTWAAGQSMVCCRKWNDSQCWARQKKQAWQLLQQKGKGKTLVTWYRKETKCQHHCQIKRANLGKYFFPLI